MRIHEKVASEEGFRARMYKCPAGKNTIAYGINLDAEPMPEEVGELWLRMKIEDIRTELAQHSWFTALSVDRQGVIIDMAYNMGVAGLFAFRRMIMALSAHDYDTAARELLDSTYARQVPNRAERNAQALITGILR